MASQATKRDERRKGELEAIAEEGEEGRRGDGDGEDGSEDRQEEKKSEEGKSGESSVPERESDDTKQSGPAGKDGKLFEAVLESLKAADEETIAYHRGDGKVTKDVTNVFLRQMIEDFMEQKQREEGMSEENQENEADELLNKRPNSLATSAQYLNSEQPKENQK